MSFLSEYLEKRRLQREEAVEQYEFEQQSPEEVLESVNANTEFTADLIGARNKDARKQHKALLDSLDGLADSATASELNDELLVDEIQGAAEAEAESSEIRNETLSEIASALSELVDLSRKVEKYLRPALNSQDDTYGVRKAAFDPFPELKKDKKDEKKEDSSVADFLSGLMSLWGSKPGGGGAKTGDVPKSGAPKSGAPKAKSPPKTYKPVATGSVGSGSIYKPKNTPVPKPPAGRFGRFVAGSKQALGSVFTKAQDVAKATTASAKLKIEAIRPQTSALVKAAEEAASKAATAVKAKTPAMAERVKDAWKVVQSKSSDTFKSVSDKVSNTNTSKLIVEKIRPVTNTLGRVTTKTVESLKPVIVNTKEAVAKTVEAAKPALANAKSSVAKAVEASKPFASRAADAVVDAGKSVKGLFVKDATLASADSARRAAVASKLAAASAPAGTAASSLTGNSSLLSKAGTVLGKVATPLTVGLSGYEAYSTEQREDLTRDQKNVQHGKTGGGLAGALAGAKLGGMVGGSAGLAAMGVGALPGAILGSIVGGVSGYYGGSYLGGKAVEATQTPPEMKDPDVAAHVAATSATLAAQNATGSTNKKEVANHVEATSKQLASSPVAATVLPTQPKPLTPVTAEDAANTRTDSAHQTQVSSAAPTAEQVAKAVPVIASVGSIAIKSRAEEPKTSSETVIERNQNTASKIEVQKLTQRDTKEMIALAATAAAASISVDDAAKLLADGSKASAVIVGDASKQAASTLGLASTSTASELSGAVKQSSSMLGDIAKKASLTFSSMFGGFSDEFLKSWDAVKESLKDKAPGFLDRTAQVVNRISVGASEVARDTATKVDTAAKNTVFEKPAKYASKALNAVGSGVERAGGAVATKAATKAAELRPVRPAGPAVVPEGKGAVNAATKANWEKYGGDIVSAADRYGVDPAAMAKLMRVESGNFDAKVDTQKQRWLQGKAGASSAEGLGQMLDGTWVEQIKRYGAENAETAKYVEAARQWSSDKRGVKKKHLDPKYRELLDAKRDAKANALMSAAFTKENMGKLEKAGVTKASEAEIYSVHMTGNVEAAKANRDNPNAPYQQVFTEKEIQNNPGYFRGSKTVGDVFNSMKKKLDAGNAYGEAATKMAANMKDPSVKVASVTPQQPGKPSDSKPDAVAPIALAAQQAAGKPSDSKPDAVAPIALAAQQAAGKPTTAAPTASNPKPSTDRASLTGPKETVAPVAAPRVQQASTGVTNPSDIKTTDSKTPSYSQAQKAVTTLAEAPKDPAVVGDRTPMPSDVRTSPKIAPIAASSYIPELPKADKSAYGLMSLRTPADTPSFDARPQTFAPSLLTASASSPVTVTSNRQSPIPKIANTVPQESAPVEVTNPAVPINNQSAAASHNIGSAFDTAVPKLDNIPLQVSDLGLVLLNIGHI